FRYESTLTHLLCDTDPALLLRLRQERLGRVATKDLKAMKKTGIYKPPKLGVSTWLWTSPFTTDSISLFPKIKSIGYDVVEIPVEYPDLIDPLIVKKALGENGLKAVVCGAF